jgi:mannose-6-phosphate isomerase-like protein (cupin superfamily)
MTQTLEPVEVAGDGGETVFLVGDTYTTLLSGAQTGGAFTLLEALVPPDTGPPPHIHHAEDETFILIEGSLTLQVGERTVDARPGAVVFVPKGTRHSFKNVGVGVARMLFIYNPPGMEGMFAEIGKPGRRGVQAPPLDPKDVEAMIAIAPKYKFSIAP